MKQRGISWHSVIHEPGCLFLIQEIHLKQRIAVKTVSLPKYESTELFCKIWTFLLTQSFQFFNTPFSIKLQH